MKNCYNAGKITGNPDAKACFHKADFEIIDLGYNPVNPLSFGQIFNESWFWRMFIDLIVIVFYCSTVYFQRNWKDSRGAKIEHRVCKFLLKKIIYQE